MSDAWKISLTITIILISSKDNNDEECVIYWKNDNIEIMINDKEDKVVEELFELLLNRYQKNLQESMKSSGFVFAYVHLLYFKCHKINPNRGRSSVDSPDWIKNKKVTINPFNKKDNKWFQYAVNVALNHKVIGEKFWKNKKN